MEALNPTDYRAVPTQYPFWLLPASQSLKCPIACPNASLGEKGRGREWQVKKITMPIRAQVKTGKEQAILLSATLRCLNLIRSQHVPGEATVT